ncbi:hypothetical protein SAMN05216256_11712 [Halopseudomonas pachastrellae]|nr:hypothetical protein [Halopseudomonas pachastrellae]SFM66741.1 hypothetical protein SAMN05216256_11712 [Halopseudomonas pachastrellae]
MPSGKRAWTPSERSTLADAYAQGVCARDIATRLNRSWSSVRGQAHQMQLRHANYLIDAYTDAEDQYLRAHATAMTRAEIAAHLGRSEGSVTQRGQRLGISFVNSRKNACYDKNHSFFQTPNADNSYLAGLLAADGCIRLESGGKKINQVSISLKYEDRYLLEWVRMATGYTGPIRIYKSGSGHLQAELRISGVPQWIQDLERNWNVTPNKTTTLKPPGANLNNAETLAFLVGFIEGDGHIGDANRTLEVSIVTASKEIADWLVIEFASISGGSPSRYLHVRGVAHYISLYGYNARRLCEQLLSLGVHKLTRKWTVAEAEIDRMRHRDLLKKPSARKNR